MIDFTPIKNRSQTFAEFSKGVTQADLRQYTNEMIDTELDIIASATDADVVFVPLDPQAKDTFGKAEEQDLAWTLGHVVVHATASSEEGAALSSSLARGLAVEGRSRYETPWESAKTVAQLHQRLAESRRMRLAFLETWPDEPHLDVVQELPFGTFNATSRFLMGLYHEDSHLEQLREIMRQAHAARE
jgi:DinB superfamily